MSDELRIAVFVDFENLAIGARDMKGTSGQFRIDVVLKRLLEKGRIVYKRAYCDWNRYREAVREFHGHGIELVDIPQSAPERQEQRRHPDGRRRARPLLPEGRTSTCSRSLSGDSDFSPLVSKLKENDKRVIGCGVKNSTSDLLVSGCDEFIFYDDLVKAQVERPVRKKKPTEKGGATAVAATTRSTRWSRSCARSSRTTTRSGVRS